jgi:hypothetical protein
MWRALCNESMCACVCVVQMVHRQPTLQEAAARQQKAESKAQEEAEVFKKRLSKKASVPITSGRQRRASDSVNGSGLPAVADGSKARPSSTTPGTTMAPRASANTPDVTSTDEIDAHYYHGLEANTQVRVFPRPAQFTCALGCIRRFELAWCTCCCSASTRRRFDTILQLWR